jgi:predicted phage tail protein
VPDTYDPNTHLQRPWQARLNGRGRITRLDFYDLVVSDRFGLGDRLTAANIDKWMLYQVAQYCDQLVPDGKGGDGMEPRYTCNVYVQDRNDAYTVLRDLRLFSGA